MALDEITEQEIQQLGPLLQKFMWSDRATHEKIQQYGAQIVPIGPYSNVPSIDDINSSYEYVEKDPPYLNHYIFDDDILATTLKEINRYASEFDPEVDGDESSARRFFWNNSQFSYSDAMAYYCFIRKFKPKTILEVGSGFSTLVAVEAARRNETGKLV